MRSRTAAFMLAVLLAPGTGSTFAAAQSVSDYRLQPNESGTAPRAQGPVDPDTPSTPRPVVTATPSAPATTAPAAPTAAPTTAPNPPATRAPRPAPQPSRTLAPVTAPAPVAAPSAQPAAAGPPPAINAPAAAPRVAPPPVVPAPPPVPAPATTPDSGIAWYWLIPALMLGALAAWFVLGRRARPAAPRSALRPAPAAPPASEPADVDPLPAPATRREPAPPEPVPLTVPAESALLDLALDAVRMSVSLVNATLHYRLRVTNVSAGPLGPISLGVDMIGAHASLPQAAQLAQDGTSLAEIHRIPALAPGEDVEVAGELRLPLAQIRPIHAGTASLFVPLVRLQARAAGLAITRVVVVGENPAAPEGLLRPFRLDQGPRIFGAISLRELAAA